MNAFPRRAGLPLAEPLTLAEALVHLREASDGGGENDIYITGLISVAREACEERIERTLITTPWLLRLDGFPSAIKLMQPPVIAVQSVIYVDEDGIEQTLSPLDYVVDTASEPGYLVPAPNAAWPATQAGAINTVRVAYTAGYGDTAASVPTPLKHWIKLALTDLYETRGGSAERPTVPHHFADALLNPYRMMGL